VHPTQQIELEKDEPGWLLMIGIDGVDLILGVCEPAFRATPHFGKMQKHHRVAEAAELIVCLAL